MIVRILQFFAVVAFCLRAWLLPKMSMRLNR